MQVLLTSVSRGLVADFAGLRLFVVTCFFGAVTARAFGAEIVGPDRFTGSGAAFLGVGSVTPDKRADRLTGSGAAVGAVRPLRPEPEDDSRLSLGR